MTVNISYNASEKNKVTKTLTPLITLTGEMVNESSVTDPVLLIQNLTSDIVSTMNYAEIVEFGRKYFITDIINVRQNLYRITLHVDVLSTYATQIKAHNAVVSRQEKKWNLYLDDGVFKTYQNPQIITKAFPSGFTTQNFVLAVAGG